ncbi:MAG: Asp23/Gls24 family envelope stress response protein [Christensenellales bacterium]|jgi:uncharacterized alkaline shock family protein YloU
MSGTIKTNLGLITISDDVIATIAGYTAVENYGIVGMSAQRAGESFFELLGRENIKKGVSVSVDEDSCVIDLYVIVEYGVSLHAVAQNVIENVTYRVREYAGLAVSSVNVHVEGVRVQQS